MSRPLSLLSHPRTLVKVAAATAVVSAVAHHRDRLPQFRWNRTLIEAVSGAAGEVAQIALVYPLDTIKVRCQAGSVGSRQVVAQLWAVTRGNWPAFLAALYAGALPAAALSILVGATHYCCFCATRRALVKLSTGSGSVSDSSRSTSGGHGDSSSSSGGGGGGAAAQQEHPRQHVFVSHGATGTHFLPVDDVLCELDAGDAGAAEQQAAAQSNSTISSSSSSNTTISGTNSSSGSSGAPGQEAPMSQQVGEGSLFVNCASAVITAALTSLVESPLELFRHNSQAGTISGSFLTEMWRVLRTSGPASLYYGLIPYCFESWPYDISELLVVGGAKDVRQHPAVRHMSPAAYDLAVGGLAGTVAVLVSMPFDVVKTYIQTHGVVGAAAGPAAAAAAGGGGGGSLGLSGSAGAFWSTGKALVQRGGPGALFIGLAPRLAHQVPGAMVCWLVIETCNRVLTEACLQERRAGAAAQQQGRAA